MSTLLLREPVRAAFGTLLVAVLGLLVALDVIDDGTSVAIGGAVAAAGAVLVELARAQVTPAVNLPALTAGGAVRVAPASTVIVGPDETVRPLDAGAGELRLIAFGVVGVLVVYALLALL